MQTGQRALITLRFKKGNETNKNHPVSLAAFDNQKSLAHYAAVPFLPSGPVPVYTHPSPFYIPGLKDNSINFAQSFT